MGAVLSTPSLSHKDAKSLSKETGLGHWEIFRLYNRFKSLDRNMSGTLSPDEILAIPEFAMNPLSERILFLFQKEQQSRDSFDRIETEIDFRTFAKTLAIFSKDSKKVAKAKALFTILDVNQDGLITREDVEQVFHMMVGSWLGAREVSEIVDRIFCSPDFASLGGRLSLEDLLTIVDSRNLIQKMTIGLEHPHSQ